MNNKQYKSIEFFIGKDALDIGRGIHDFYIALTYDDLKAIRHPRLFIRKSDNKGILRLNFCTYFPVAIPDHFKAELDKCKQVDVIFSSKDNSEQVSQNAPVSHVLKFPELYELNQQPSEPDTGDGGNLSDIQENSPLDPMGALDADLSLREDDEQEPENFEHCSCQHALEQWLSEHENFSMSVQKYRDHRLCFITDNVSEVFVIYLFETAGEWIADEEKFNSAAPLYFSKTNHVVSPVYAVTAIADYWQCHTGIEVNPLVLLDDAVSIINEEDMSLTWMMNSAALCSCNRKYRCGVIKNFDKYMNALLAENRRIFTADQIAVLSQAFHNLDEISYQEALYTALRTFQLDQMLPDEYTVSDVIMTWLKGNYCKSILLARYWDKKSGGFFNLIYNFSNIAIFFENNSMIEDPAAAVISIREKLQKSGIASALPPCVIVGDNASGYEAKAVKCYDYESLFLLEDRSFAREMEFEKYSAMSPAEVRALVCFANVNFIRDTHKVAEKYAPEYAETLLTVFNEIEEFCSGQKMIAFCETKLFENLTWTLIQQTDRKKTIIAVKSLVGDQIEDDRGPRQEEQKKNCLNASLRTSIKTVVLVPERITKTWERAYFCYEDIFYVGIKHSAKLICKILTDN